MGTIALLNDLPPERADAWHRVQSPGGFEWWHFDAWLEGNVRIAVDFFEGCPLHPEYIRRFRAYLARPTRNAPPVPSEYPCMRLEVAENGKLLGRAMTRYEPSQFEASDAECRVKIAGNSIEPGEGRLCVHVEAIDRGITADLTFFSEAGNLIVREPMSREMTGADHFWLVLPYGTVEGTIQLANGRKIESKGEGYHDHRYGTGPIGAGIRRLVIGRASTSSRTIAFQLSQSENASIGEEQKIVVADESGTRELECTRLNPHWDMGRRTIWGLVYPTAINAGQVLILREPRVLACDASRMWMEYIAFLDGEEGEAVCEIIYPGRLSGELIGRWIERGLCGR